MVVDDHRGRSRRRALQLGSLTLIGTGIGLATGVIDPRAPFFGIPALWANGRDEAARLSAEDTADDGVNGSVPLDLEGRAVAYEDGIDSARMRITPASGQRFDVPSVGLNAPLNMMSTIRSPDGGREATPPGFRSVYVLRDLGIGQLGEGQREGRVIALAHSAMGRVGPGNYLIDNHSGDPVIGAGEHMVCAGVDYVIARVEQIKKTALPHREDVWGNDPGTLSFITCRQIGGPRTTHNTVFFAKMP